MEFAQGIRHFGEGRIFVMFSGRLSSCDIMSTLKESSVEEIYTNLTFPQRILCDNNDVS